MPSATPRKTPASAQLAQKRRANLNKRREQANKMKNMEEKMKKASNHIEQIRNLNINSENAATKINSVREFIRKRRTNKKRTQAEEVLLSRLNSLLTNKNRALRNRQAIIQQNLSNLMNIQKHYEELLKKLSELNLKNMNEKNLSRQVMQLKQVSKLLMNTQNKIMSKIESSRALPNK